MPPNHIRHYGVPGMRWGIRKPEPKGKGRVKSSDVEAYKKKHASLVASLGLNERALRAKYEFPDAEDFKKFVKEHQDDIIAGGIAVGLLGALYIATRPSGSRKAALTAFGQAVDGLAINWDEGVDLPIGSIVKRISTVAETEVRPSGFFASFKEADIQSYKAILPGFWEQWGIGSPAKGGFVNSYQALEAVKAPSGSETFAIFKDLIQNDVEYRAQLEQYSKIARILSLGQIKAYKNIHTLGDDQLRDVLRVASGTWAQEISPLRHKFVKAVQAKGYNAIIDFNDAGRLAKTPVLFLNGSQFKVVDNTPLTPEDIIKALNEWSPTLVHEEVVLKDQYLMHYGVLGMRWGVRKPEEVAARRAKRDKLRQEIAAGKARKRADRAAKRYARLTNTPYRPDRNQYQHRLSLFESTVLGLGTGALGVVIGAIVRPSADKLGKYVLKYGSVKIAEQARKKAIGF